nr:phage major capsid protein [uncultured Oscillibacter sp.]
MALKALLLKRQIDEKKNRMAALSAKTMELDTREQELEAALAEASTEAELRSVQELVDAFSTEQEEHRAAVHALEQEIAADEEELRTLEAKTPPPLSPTPAPLPAGGDERRKDDVSMSKRMTRAFGNMTMEQRAAFIQREEVQDFLTRFREMFKGGQKRSVSGGELLIPTVVLELLRQNIEDYSKMLRHVRVLSVAGRSRQPVMGAIPEAVWTEACAALNELNFTFSEVEVDGYMVGGYVAICNALLEDSDPSLLSEIIIGMGGAIGISVDKAILFGTGVKMPLGIAARLAQTSKPSDYPKNARAWQNLSQSNVITIPSGTTGLALFQALTRAVGAAKGRYSIGGKFWAMNEATHTTIQTEAMSINAAGAIVSAMDDTMPVVGGDILVFPNDIMPDNTIIGGYGNLYLLAERAGSSVEHSDIPLFLQNQTVVKGTARYDGKPVIPEAFVAIGLGKEPTLEMDFVPDVANPSVAALRSLAIGALALEPSFHPDTLEYTASTSNATNMISVVPTTGSLASVKVNGKKVQNGAAAAWEDGENTVSVTVANGDKTKTYTVAVTKN